MHLQILDYAILAIYLVAIFVLAQIVGRTKGKKELDTKGYFLAGGTLPWWAIGASLIAANISAEQIVGMSGSGYAIGLAIASYEWMAALTLLIVGKFFLPVFLKNGIYTMPGFLKDRYGEGVQLVMAVFWLLLYVFVNVTSILWLGSIAASTVTGVNQMYCLYGIALFALLYQIAGGLKSVALTDIVQVTLLVIGGLIIGFIGLSHIGDQFSHGGNFVDGFAYLVKTLPDHFVMILDKSSPHYKELPGIAVILGGMWVMNVSYWGFNQYIIQRALAAKSTSEAQKGIAFAAFLKLLMPVIVVLPGIAAVVLRPGLMRPDQAYPQMMTLLPTGLLGLVFSALIAAIIASLASKINSIATLFTLDIYSHLDKGATQHKQVFVGRIAAVVAVIIGVATAQPILGNAPQAFQLIQDYTGYFTPGIVVIFILGLFWKRASGAGALTAAIGSAALSIVISRFYPDFPFMNRVGVVFIAALVAAVLVSLIFPSKRESMVSLEGVSFKTSSGFNIAGALVILILVGLYVVFK